MRLINKGRHFFKAILALIAVSALFSACRVSREVATAPGPDLPEAETATGLDSFCLSADTIRSILISKAHTLYLVGDQRYEAEVSVYALKDSMVYVSAVNSGFEILRALVRPDSIQVIDRVNRVVYQTPVKKRFGHQNPLNFNDIQNLISVYYLCDDLGRVRDLSLSRKVLHFDEPHIAKKITLDGKTSRMDKFEFFHDQTGKYFMGERKEEGFTLFTNFMMGEVEVRATGGACLYNVEIPVRMSINRRRYSFVNL